MNYPPEDNHDQPEDDQPEDDQLVVFKDEEAHYKTYEAAITAAVNWVTNKKFDLGKHEKRVLLHRKFKEKMVLYPRSVYMIH